MSPSIKPALAILALLLAPPPYTVVVVGSGLSDGSPIVIGVVNRRIPSSAQRLHLIIDPSPPANTAVHWSSPDGKNDIGPGTLFLGSYQSTYDAPVGDYVSLLTHDDAVGDAVIVADVGSPVNTRATFFVRDRVGVGFGCYGFMPQGPSLRIVDGRPEGSSLHDADVAVVGPGNREGVGPGYGCWGDNFDARAKAYRLVFKYGGRAVGRNRDVSCVHEMPFDAVDSAHPVDVATSDGHTYRLHVSPRSRHVPHGMARADRRARSAHSRVTTLAQRDVRRRGRI